MFKPQIPKKKVEYGKVRKALGDLLDREGSKSDFLKGIAKLAQHRGETGLDKKDIPILALAAPSESGKTEFLKWIHNDCCTCIAGEETDTARLVLDLINEGSPDGQVKFDNTLVLFATFNQNSTFDFNLENRGNIVQTTIERLLRSYEGNLHMSRSVKTDYDRVHFDGFDEFIDIVTAVEKVRGRTAFIFCIDELSEVRTNNKEAYSYLMKALQEFVSEMLALGNFCAVVASSLRIADFGETVLQESRRALSPIYFPIEKPKIKEKSVALFLESTRALSMPETDKADSNLKMYIVTNIIESSTSI